MIDRRDFLRQTLAVPLADLPRESGCALVLDVSTRRILHCEGSQIAGRWLVAPGSTVKSITLWTLLRLGRVKADEAFVCPQYLQLNGVQMNCSHPRLPFPVDIRRAITYSCNCATAHFSQHFQTDELAQSFDQFGFSSLTHLSAGEVHGRVDHALHGDSLQLQALGERGASITALELAEAYRKLAALAGRPEFAPILDGLEGAVSAGTAQAAQVPGISVAGKTGSVYLPSGARAAWFAGFAPSRHPEVVVTVLTQGRSGATAAAPTAGELLRRHFRVTA